MDPQQSPQGTDSGISSLSFDGTGVLRLVWERGVDIDAPQAEAAMARVDAAAGQDRVPLLIDMATTSSVSRSARAVFARPCAAAAIALLGASAVDRVLANFFLGVYKAPCPTKFFTDEARAVAWLAEAADGS
ncbi:STAS/SEC14 domain-containing protein [Sinomonas atrocyanea]|uniref:DUF7793 family protein n=1 Tax=Sinomonas atrocyanea TaxID=37927 RepID=UPI002862952D|nr:STAS/SEC14 domain-containing protein [Sinomonas atrocyanea]MDR6620884.1 hypothetical protein [Sinomonas atrocyanea]